MPGKCSYPQSYSTRRDIQTELAAVAANKRRCASVYLDTVEGMSNPSWTEGDDHHQGLARTHKLSDGSIYFFLSNSETDPGDQGVLSHYRYDGPTNHDHFLTTRPLTVAPMAAPLLQITEQHPSDITFLPEVDGRDAGYLFVTEEFDSKNLTVYRWQPGERISFHDVLGGFPANANGPQFVFIDLVGDEYYLGLASTHWGFGKVFRAPAEELFPACKPGGLNLSAFKRRDPEIFELPEIGSPSQTKLVRDSTGAWYLLGFLGDPADDPNGDDYVDGYAVSFAPFTISERRFRIHVYFRAGDTGFANTGTHYVERSGRLLVSSSYRWSNDEGPGRSSFVSRVDELTS